MLRRRLSQSGPSGNSSPHAVQTGPDKIGLIAAAPGVGAAASPPGAPTGPQPNPFVMPMRQPLSPSVDGGQGGG
jgi:hypothetical protein